MLNFRNLSVKSIYKQTNISHLVRIDSQDQKSKFLPSDLGIVDGVPIPYDNKVYLLDVDSVDDHHTSRVIIFRKHKTVITYEDEKIIFHRPISKE